MVCGFAELTLGSHQHDNGNDLEPFDVDVVCEVLVNSVTVVSRPFY